MTKSLIVRMKGHSSIVMILIFLLTFISVGAGLGCFECSSVNDNFCPDVMSADDEEIVPFVDCQKLYEAQYCVKTTGVTGGSLGTRRFCSSRDMGNYCDYIKRPGDQLEYRSCVYTCTGTGCNSAPTTIKSSISVILATSVLSALAYHVLH